ncbi:MAG TPA: hypothetical protein PLM33_03015 [Acidobacteriota bacterium]|jgi:hypothetical protein|nr:hypothetical protein [Acidobacteriota bacterium]HRV09151.1 hypothetical protein [Acidobacteriota bacterium]
MLTRKHLLWVVLIGPALSSSVVSAAPVEFTARIDAASVEGETTLLTMQVTPAATLPVLVTGLTEIKDRNGLPAGVDALVPDLEVKVGGLFTASGVLALEIEIVGGREFELKGQIQVVDTQGRTMQVLGFVIEVPEAARIQGPRGESLTFAELEAARL